MMSEPKTEPIPAPDPATPTVAAPDQKYEFQLEFQKIKYKHIRIRGKRVPVTDRRELSHQLR